MVMPTKQALNTKNALTANNTSHVNSKPNIVFDSTSEMDNFISQFISDFLQCDGISMENLQHNGEDSSVPSEQWFMPSHVKSVDMQNSVDKHLSSLHAWSAMENALLVFRKLKNGFFSCAFAQKSTLAHWYSWLPSQQAWIHSNRFPNHQSHTLESKNCFVWLYFPLIALCYDKICPSGNKQKHKCKKLKKFCTGIFEGLELLSVFRLHERHHKYKDDHCNRVEEHQI